MQLVSTIHSVMLFCTSSLEKLPPLRQGAILIFSSTNSSSRLLSFSPHYATRSDCLFCCIMRTPHPRPISKPVHSPHIHCRLLNIVVDWLTLLLPVWKPSVQISARKPAILTNFSFWISSVPQSKFRDSALRQFSIFSSHIPSNSHHSRLILFY
jgi:hypothetical protein